MSACKEGSQWSRAQDILTSVERIWIHVRNPLYVLGCGIPYSYVKRILFLSTVMWAKVWASLLPAAELIVFTRPFTVLLQTIRRHEGEGEIFFVSSLTL